MPDVNKLLRELRENYIAELPERINVMESHVLSLSTDKTLYSFQELYRQVHSHKGSAGTHGVHIITSICHQFEDELNKVDDNLNKISDENINLWLAYLDLLKEAYEKVSEEDADTSNIEEALSKLRNSVNETDYSCLLVDTHSSTLSIVKRILEEHSINITVMNDGYLALGRLLNTKYDILVCGLQIAKLNGVGLISAIKSSSSINCNIPSILLTASDYSRTIRSTDPDYVIIKDVNLPASLDKSCKNIITNFTQK